MPLLHLAPVLSNPSLVDEFTVYRRTETVGEDGISTVTYETIPFTYGIVTPGGTNDLVQGSDAEYAEGLLDILTTFPLRGPGPAVLGDPAGATGQKPDQVGYLGDCYEVLQVQPYLRYGSGFVQAKLGSIDALDLPQEG